jgi:hypothetical protein
MDEFLAWAGEKGELNKTTAGLLRSTVGKVLSIDGDASEIDVTQLDVDSVLRRWETLNRTKYSEGSAQTYKSRFKQAIAMYNAWLVNDPGWKDAGKAAGSGMTPRPRKGVIKKTASAKSKPAPAPQEEHEALPTAATRLLAYDLPLRPDLIVRLNLPVDLNEHDAARIAAFVKSVAFTATPGPVAPLAAKSTLEAG